MSTDQHLARVPSPEALPSGGRLPRLAAQVASEVTRYRRLPEYFIGVAYMAKWFYPELFEDLNPKSIHQEYLTRFQGLDYDLNEHGVFVYPAPGES